jgi:hypothetical protein
VDDDGQRLRIVFDRRGAGPLLALIGAGCDRVALAASHPSSMRTVQVKGHGARVEPLPIRDRDEVAHSVAALRVELGRIGFGDPFAATLYDYDPDELVCVGFVPDAIFDQTPGPRAGEALATRP